MRIIDDVAMRFPAMDLESVRILLQIYETPGFSIRELSDVLRISPKHAKLKVSLLAAGRNTLPGSSRLGLIDTKRKASDRRKCDLMLTDAGEILAEKLKSLNAQIAQEE